MTESTLFDSMMDGNITASIINTYTTPIGPIFFIILWFLACLLLYIKLENADIVVMMSCIYGASGLILLPAAAQPYMALILGIGLASLLYRAFSGTQQ